MSFDPPANLQATTQAAHYVTPGQTTAHRNRTWREATGEKESSVRLERCPPELNLDDRFPEPLAYDPVRKRLTYRGFMYSHSYRFLRQLSGDIDYLAALDELYLATSEPQPAGRALLSRMLVAAVSGSLAMAVAAAWFLMR